MVNAPVSTPPATYRIETLLPDTSRVRDAAHIQLAAFDPFVEYQSVIEPLPRAPMEVRLDRLEFRINEKLRAKSNFKYISGESESGGGSSHLGYVAINEQTGETVGMSYWMRPGRSHKLPNRDVSAGKMTEEQKESWEGWDTERYGKLYEAFQGKMSAVLSERGEEEGCWYLEILAIHPSYQGLRLGPKLLDHHLAQIDHPETIDVQNAPAYLESSPPAKRLYTSRGFEDVGDVTAEGWEDAFPAMFRPRQTIG